MSVELFRRVKTLEEKVARLESQLAQSPTTVKLEQKKIKLCPHCQAVPAYHFHVKNCTANKKKNNGDDGRPDPSTA